MSIGSKLTELMALRKTNPNQLAKATGVNVNTIYAIIRRNSTRVNLDDLQSICDELGVNLDYFADNEKPPLEPNPPSNYIVAAYGGGKSQAAGPIAARKREIYEALEQGNLTEKELNSILIMVRTLSERTRS